MNDLAQIAISQALAANWPEAIKTNREILKKDPDNLDALNRLAYAYAENGQISPARTSVKKVLKLNPHDRIAAKCLARLQNLTKNDYKKGQIPLLPCSFLEEPGKTKIVNLINLGTNQTLAQVKSGDQVNYNPQGHRVSILTENGKYLGRIPDDIGLRLKKCHKLGKEYQIFIKATKSREARIFIKETASSLKAQNLVSFPEDS